MEEKLASLLSAYYLHFIYIIYEYIKSFNFDSSIGFES